MFIIHLCIYFLFASETFGKFRCLRKNAQIILIHSLEKAVWNWMDTYPGEFAELQVGNFFFFLFWKFFHERKEMSCNLIIDCHWLMCLCWRIFIIYLNFLLIIYSSTLYFVLLYLDQGWWTFNLYGYFCYFWYLYSN